MRFKCCVDSIFSLRPFRVPPFVSCCVLIKSVLIKSFFLFLFSAKYARIGSVSLCVSPPIAPAFAQPDSDSWHLSEMALPGHYWAQSGLSAWRWPFSTGLTSIPQHSLTQRILPLAPRLCHFEVFWLLFAFFSESCVVLVGYAGLKLQRSMLELRMCTKMSGLPALGSKSCFVSSPGILYFFGFNYCHLWLWQLTL